MLKVGLIGIGFMGRGHLDNYIRLEEEGFPVQLTAVCDVDEEKFSNIFVKGNIDLGSKTYDFSKYSLYTDYRKMLEEEELDYVDIALPTYLHAEVSCYALRQGVHVLCEKPMALSTIECQQMIDAADDAGRQLMVAQCLRFWPEYEAVKEIVDSGRFGAPTGAYFYRGGGTPRWSFENWLLTDEKSGGALLDQHIHDVDTLNWMFGPPTRVSTIARNVIPGSGYDIVSTNYIYPSRLVVNAQDDWTLNGDNAFGMTFRVNFEKGNCIYEGGVLRVYPNDGESYVPELSKDSGYIREIRYFADCVRSGQPTTRSTPISTRVTIAIAEAEVASADQQGAVTPVDF